ncbi:MAG: ATP-NAD kinase family protein [Rikenellaceae bacterium]
MKRKVGLIINPIAGMGGSVGLKGTDGVVEEAILRGAVPKAEGRTEVALKELLPIADGVVIYAAKGPMGGDLSEKMGFETMLVENGDEKTSNLSTQRLARELVDVGVDVIVFSGGDGTARDIFSAIGDRAIVLGVPAGVKIHSPVYAQSPTKAGELLVRYLSGDSSIKIEEAEVLDIDEVKYREGIVNTQLFGYLKIPYKKEYVQNKKSGTPVSECATQELISYEITDNMEEGTYYVIGGGTTMRSVMQKLELPYTLIGVDIVKDRKVVVNDATERQILDVIKGEKAKLVLTVTGGQGYLLGRGNQQISASVVREVGVKNIIIVATRSKLLTFLHQPLLVDTGDVSLDEELCGYVRIITSYKESIMYKIAR